MVTLRSFAEQMFPNRPVEVDGDAPFDDHTTVGQITSEDRLKAFRLDLVESLPGSRVAIATVRATEPSIVPNGGEDPEGVADLPKRRPAAAGIGAGLLAGVVAGVILGFVVSVAAGVILGVFVAVIVGIVSAIAGGGARFAGERAWQQPNKPSADLYLIAAYTADESEATTAATTMERAGITEVRIVNREGAWRSPNT